MTAHSSPFEDPPADLADAPLAAREPEATETDLIGLGVNVPPGKRAVVYLRVSSKGQVATDYDPEGISIPAQRLSCQRKAEQLGLTVVAEYAELGQSGTEMSRRVAFQQMLNRIRQERDVDYVVVYKLSRFARNRIDDAMVMADLQKQGVTLVSATEQIDDTPVGQLMHGILASFNEYRSREDGADISYKMAQKVKNGGTVGRAPLGYLNTVDLFDGRRVNTVVVDAARAPFIKLAFELYATGKYGIDELAEELTTRGLLMRPTAVRQAVPISNTQLTSLLRDPYYIGEIQYKGESYAGRHEPLIDKVLFERVQRVAGVRALPTGERRRVHHNYLKGTLWCGECRANGRPDRRMIVQRSIGRNGHEYFYFFCRGKQDHSCSSPHSSIERVEAAVEEHYKSVKLSPKFVKNARASLDKVLRESESSQRLLRDQLSTQLEQINAREENLLDLAADGTLPRDRIKGRLLTLAAEREEVQERLTETNTDLAASAKAIDEFLQVLDDPYELYSRLNDASRRALNQALFKRIYVVNDEVTDDEMTSPIAEMIEADRLYSANANGTTGKGGPVEDKVTAWLKAIDPDDVSSKDYMVDPRGFEPLTSSMRTRRATNCAKGPETAPQRYHLSQRRPNRRPRQPLRAADG